MSDTGTLTLTEFLLARIAEDRNLWTLAREADLAFTVRGPVVPGVPPSGFADRMLAECEAKRAAVREATYWIHDARPISPNAQKFARWLLLNLALPYTDHPDCHPDWRP